MHVYEIIPYNDHHQPVFKALNLEWLDLHGLTEQHDLDMLGDPRRHIIDTGGAIFLVQYQGEIIASLELMMNLPTDRFVLLKENLPEAFFDLKTGLAGEILQKVVNYARRVAIVGDYSAFTSKSLRDFMYESNKSRHVAFVDTTEAAIEKLKQ